MAWIPIFLNVTGKKIFVLGSGEVARRRAKKFIKAGAEVILGSNKSLRNFNTKPLHEMEKWIKWADIVIVATPDKYLNEKATKLAKNKLVNRADDLIKGNIAIPSVFSINDIQISIFTKGKSPLMAKYLKEKIKSCINEEDVLNVELQNYARKKIKNLFNDHRERKKILYKLFNDKKIKEYLKDGNLEKAKNYVDKLLQR
ncbi:siroheme synthase [Methanothermus fervidus DSM 2088]|uniref:precorrin-2 dehydrogenase n=1 Tax=Methanothermus fervidus (strain ATCC 43054 / DSM 2088 / JCM 10308 / V24 S) TaxID=523846 RepID=E3GXT5_METFV|nr:bifunctional precorrin-2 dehydrogenase/sirohydrochlorin ferrochelatase [Methanothermus fervidus]ADP77117.1 siroheme synthase [Methanothermus fervidus DSM 2088]